MSKTSTHTALEEDDTDFCKIASTCSKQAAPMSPTGKYIQRQVSKLKDPAKFSKLGEEPDKVDSLFVSTETPSQTHIELTGEYVDEEEIRESGGSLDNSACNTQLQGDKEKSKFKRLTQRLGLSPRPRRDGDKASAEDAVKYKKSFLSRFSRSKSAPEPTQNDITL